MQELQKTYRFNFGISSTIFHTNLEDADNILAWAKKEKLDIVFNNRDRRPDVSSSEN